MKIFFDTEFIEDGKTIDLISIGMVREDSEKLYLVSSEYDASKASQWVKDNVLKYIHPYGQKYTRKEIAETVRNFVLNGEVDKPEFWAYYADYDWVVLCQLFGTMMDLPKGFPMYCNDLKQHQHIMARRFRLPKNPDENHHALADAIWVREAYYALEDYIRLQENMKHKDEVL
jgi:hypothetical protein